MLVPFGKGVTLTNCSDPHKIVIDNHTDKLLVLCPFFDGQTKSSGFVTLKSFLVSKFRGTELLKAKHTEIHQG